MARGYLVRDPSKETIRSKTDPQIQKWGIGKPDDVGVRTAVIEVAERLGVPRAHVAIAWLLSKQAVSAPIIGATKQSHIPDAVAALNLQLSSEDITTLEAPYRPQVVAGHD